MLLLSSTALVALSLKQYYATAGPDDLRWILAPTAWLSGAITGTAFTLQPGEGYLSIERMFLIEKSCAGVNFLIAAFGLLALARGVPPAAPRAIPNLLAVSLASAYVAAVIVNAARIAIAVWLAEGHMGQQVLSAADIHRLEGVIVYFGGLLLLYEAARRLESATLGAEPRA